MSVRYDVVVIGAGHNGLVCAATLARAGRSVLVVERAETVGGTAANVEIAPGYRCAPCFPSAELFDREVARDLRLADHGVEFLDAPGSVFVADVGGGLVVEPGDDRAGPRFGRPSDGDLDPADVVAAVELDRFLRRLSGALEPLFASPLPDLEELDAGDKLDLLRIGWRLRRLGRADMVEALRFLPMPVRDVVRERFDDEALQAAVAAAGLTASWLGPFSAGSALGLAYHRPRRAGGLFGAPSFVRGGSGALCEGLAAAARAAGAELRTGAEVARVRGRNGRAGGVVLAGGEEVAARAVVSSADPRRTFVDLVDPLQLTPDFVGAVRNLKGRGSVATVAWALDGAPRFAAASNGSCPAGRIQIGGTVDELERAFDDAKRGSIPERPWIEMLVPTLTDPTLAPEGKHVAIARVQWVPSRLADGHWEQWREALGEAVTSRVVAHSPGFESLVRARQVWTPVDLETRFGVTDGCLYHVDMTLDQMLYLRPLPGWSAYRMPLEGLYLGGSGSHPGGGLTGRPGRNAAQCVLADLKRGLA